MKKDENYSRSLSTRAIIKIIVMSEAIMSHSGVLFLEHTCVPACVYIYKLMNESRAHHQLLLIIPQIQT
jgi:hypothetical protein